MIKLKNGLAQKILNAHENNPKQDLKEKEMDLFNNKVGLDDFKANPNRSDKEILERFKNRLKENKFKILKPKYQDKRGLP